MRVLAIDPGTNSLGWALLTDESGNVELENYGGLQFDGSEPLIERLNSIYIKVVKLLRSSSCDVFMCEKTWRVDRNSLALVAAIKVIKEIAEMVDGLDVRQVLAVTARKKFSCGARDSATAKARVQAFVLENFDIPNDMVSDIYDAILLGLFVIETS